MLRRSGEKETHSRAGKNSEIANNRGIAKDREISRRVVRQREGPRDNAKDRETARRIARLCLKAVNIVIEYMTSLL